MSTQGPRPTAFLLSSDDDRMALVTETDDPAEARRVLLADPALVAEMRWFREDDEGHENLGPVQQAERWLDVSEAVVEFGSFVPDPSGECARQWRRNAAGGRVQAYGETCAVRFIERLCEAS